MHAQCLLTLIIENNMKFYCVNYKKCLKGEREYNYHLEEVKELVRLALLDKELRKRFFKKEKFDND